MTVEALRRGSPEVLADLLAGYGRELHAVAFLIVRDRAAAEDIVADSLLAALDRGATLRDAGALRPWLLPDRHEQGPPPPPSAPVGSWSSTWSTRSPSREVVRASTIGSPSGRP